MVDKKKELEKIIKYSFKNNSLLSQSLTHKSFDNINNNEKLEFLGDRVLGLVISQKLLEKFPHLITFDILVFTLIIFLLLINKSPLMN